MTTATLTPLVRRVELDRLRGLAIALMIGDHLARVWAFEGYRLTLGRLAVPLFFIIGGHLAGRRGASWRYLEVLCWGVILPAVVPWVDSPNVLVWYVIGAMILYVFDSRGWPTWLLIVPALILGANGWSELVGAGYNPAALLALMALGRGLSGDVFRFGLALPSWLAVVGRYPLSWYVGHVLALQVVLVAVGHA